MSEYPLNGLLLIGGESRRMGRDKAALVYHEGLSQAEWTCRLLAEVCPKVFVSIRAGQALPPGETLARAGRIPDAEGLGIRGPMAGILSALQAHPDQAFLVLSCDLPRLTPGTLRHLISSRRPDLPATAFKSAHDGLPEPLCAIYEPAMRPAMEAVAAEGRTCPRKLLINGPAHLLDLPDPAALDNINTPEEFAALAPPEPVEKSLRLQYFALLSTQRGLFSETLKTRGATPREVYAELTERHGFTLPAQHVRVAINEEFAHWDTPLQEGDELVFLPPMSGG
jgi:molybdopterin-guanine dinucleotide biosynthesis protein A